MKKIYYSQLFIEKTVKRIIIFVFLVLCLSTFMAANLFAQNIQHTVSGTVTDVQSGDPLPGVTIKLKGTTTGTHTDANGKYDKAAMGDLMVSMEMVIWVI